MKTLFVVEAEGALTTTPTRGWRRMMNDDVMTKSVGSNVLTE